MQTEQTTRLAFRYRLYPTKVQVALLEETLGICRSVFNALVHERTVIYETTGKSPGWAQQCREIAAWKPSHAELGTVNAQVLQNVAKRVDLAFQAFFRRVKAGVEPGYPRLKGKGHYDSLTYPQFEGGFSFVRGRLRLSKVGDLAIHLHRPIDGDIKTCTVRRTATAKWYACFSCEVEPERLPFSNEEVGIDVGIKVFAALSNGEFIENPRFFRMDEKALAKAQRKFDKVKNKHRTKARRKAKKVVSRIHERIKHRRHNFVHQTARRLVNRFGVIAVEALQVENMIRRPKPKPDPENEGQFLPNGASSKAGLNKSISDASWSMFCSVLTNKAENAGRLVVAVPAAYTSQKCSGCGNIAKKTLKERTHKCLVCGLVLDRDTNAAVNIKAIGQYSLATLIA
jgi:putative transposase